MFSRTPPRAPYICARCLVNRQKRSAFSSSPKSQTSPSPPPPPASGAAHLPTRRLISLHGDEAPKFLQGLITNNIALPPAPARQPGFYAAFLTAPGKVLHDVFVYPTLGSRWHKSAYGADEKGLEQPGYLVEVDGAEVEVLMRHIRKHKLRSRFRIRVVEEGELGVWGMWRGEERWTAHSQSTTQGSGVDEGMLGLVDSRAPGMGQRVLLPPSSRGGSGLPEKLEVEEAPLSAYTIRRYLKGVPEGQQEVPRDDSLPMNYNIDIMGGIDFKKGCYLGQELTIRTQHTGVVRRRVLPVQLYPHSLPPPEVLAYDPSTSISLNCKMGGDSTVHLDIKRDDKRKRATGKLIASVCNIGLGMCRLEQMSDLTISGEGSSFSAEDGFVVEEGDGDGVVGVKAFVPDWMSGRIRGARVQKRVQ